jgi:hypothetical protein
MTNLLFFIIAAIALNIATTIRTLSLGKKRRKILFILTNAVIVILFIWIFLIKGISFSEKL